MTAQVPEADEDRYCSVCMLELTSRTELDVGVHVRCLYNTRTRRDASVRPRYGFNSNRRNPSDGDDR